MDAALPYRLVHNLPNTVSAGNYKMVNMGKDTSSWAALFTVPVYPFVPEVVL